jgi:Bacterial transglutaminase-like N-terminal region
LAHAAIAAFSRDCSWFVARREARWIVIDAAIFVFGAKYACYPRVSRGVAMTILIVRHITTYRYKQPVSFGEHRMMLRPRESLDQRVLGSKLEISPKPTDLRWTQDVFGNHVAVARFAGRAQALRFDSTMRIDHSPADMVEMDMEGFARAYPFTYGAEDMPDLQAPTPKGSDQAFSLWVLPRRPR